MTGRGLSAELLSRGGEAVAVVRPQPSRQSKQVLSSHLPAPAQVVLGATHPVLYDLLEASAVAEQAAGALREAVAGSVT